MRPEELTKMLPSQAKATLTAYFLVKLEEAPLNCYADSTYRLVNALAEFDTGADEYACSILIPCFNEAQKEFDVRHPKTWDSINQVPGRSLMKSV